MSDIEFPAVMMKPEEVLYTYSNCQDISMRTGLIGYLRADMGRNGNEFWSTWNDFRSDLKTPEFKSEFDDVINSQMEKGGFLSNRDSLSNFCYDRNKALKFGERFGAGRDYGVRVNTQNYAYLMRLNPNRGEYNLYCYCYKKDLLDNHIAKAKRGICFCDTAYKEIFRLEDGDRIRIVQSDYSKYDRTCRYIDDYHFESTNRVFHIHEFADCGERFGWHEVIPLRASLPDKYYFFLQTENKIGIVNKGEQGYTEYKFSKGTPEENRWLADEMNKKLGITKAQAEAMVAGSMFGWHTPAADPKNYDENGKAIKPKHKDRER